MSPSTLNQRIGNWRVGIPVLAFWLAMMGWLWQREFAFKRLAPPPKTAVDFDASSDSWLALTLANGQQVGYVHVGQQPEERHGAPGRRLELSARMKLNLLGKLTELDLAGSTWQARDEPRLELDFALRSAGHDLRLVGTVENGALHGEVRSAGEILPLEIPIDRELIFTSGFGTATHLPVLEVGEQVELDSFDPLTLGKSVWRVRCLAREDLTLDGSTVSTRRLEVIASGLKSRVWIDENGEVVRAETPLGLRLEKASAQTALSSTVAADADDFLDLTAIVPRGPRPFRGAATMTVALTGLPHGELPTSALQSRLENGHYRLETPPDPSSILAGEGTTLLAAERQALLASDVFVQADHPRIRNQAAEIIGDESDPWRRAVLIYDWVYTRLEKEAVVSIPSALEVLAEKRGDCNEHTVLFAALARAVGLPTRIAIGLVWSDELAGFYYHAWPEVYVERFVRMDPTLGQPLADATHLELLSGGIESWPRLLPYLGSLGIEVVEIR